MGCGSEKSERSCFFFNLIFNSSWTKHYKKYKYTSCEQVPDNKSIIFIFNSIRMVLKVPRPLIVPLFGILKSIQFRRLKIITKIWWYISYINKIVQGLWFFYTLNISVYRSIGPKLAYINVWQHHFLCSLTHTNNKDQNGRTIKFQCSETKCLKGYTQEAFSLLDI